MGVIVLLIILFLAFLPKEPNTDKELEKSMSKYIKKKKQLKELKEYLWCSTSKDEFIYYSTEIDYLKSDLAKLKKKIKQHID